LEIIIFKDSITAIISRVNPGIENEWYTSRTFIALVISVLEIPSILVKKIERLKFMAFIGVTGILVFMGTVVIHYAITAA
jgi:amino acid permease